MQFPMVLRWPQRGKLLAAEASACADNGFVNAHLAESDRPQQPAGADDILGAPRLADHDERCKPRHAREEANKLLVDEMMQEEVAGDDVRARRPRIGEKVEDIRRARFHAPSQRRKRLARRATDNIL